MHKAVYLCMHYRSSRKQTGNRLMHMHSPKGEGLLVQPPSPEREGASRAEVGMGKMSRDKGKRGEREVAAWLAKALPGVGVRRTGQDQAHQQKTGENKPSDIWTDGILSVEVKRYKRLTWGVVKGALLQAVKSSPRGSAYPLCCVREDRGEWVVAMRLEDFTELLREWYERGMR